MIETLDEASQTDVVATIGAAFSSHPMMPPDPSGGRSRLMVTSLLEAFAEAPDARVFGIRRDGDLDCAAFVYDAAYEPGGLKLVFLLFRMLRVLGWRMCRTFARVMSEKPGAEERQLELMIIGTRTESQGQGLGRAMLQHIFEFARVQGYRSVVLEVAKETPAYGFYVREGFLIEKEVTLPTLPLCFLRRPIAGQGADDGETDRER